MSTLTSSLLGELDRVRADRARLDAREAVLLARLESVESDFAGLVEALRPVLRGSRAQVEKRVALASTLASDHPGVLAAMARGEIDAYGASRVVAVTSGMSAAQVRQVDSQLAAKLSSAPTSTFMPDNLAAHTRKIANSVDPDGQAARARVARRGRKVELVHGENAMSRLTAHVPVEVASAAYARVDALAKALRRAGSSRSMDQLRADVTADLLLGRDVGVTAPETAATVSLHMPASTALGITNSGCTLDGYGTIPAPIAREIMTNPHSTWRKVLCDPTTGTPTSLGRTRRRPSATIRELVRIRDRECVVPWCHRPATHTDFDHEQPWTDGGPTSATNGTSRCRHHHRLKHHPRWTHSHNPTRGTTTITTPHGTTYTATNPAVLRRDARPNASRDVR
nr:HNH endonuclease signature motif containing protein [Saccharomonospora sp. CUA-673]